LPAGFVYLRDLAPTIPQDIRYAGPDNFTGRALPGYEAPECILQEPAARAVAAAQADLAARGFGLKMYDCYRPLRAVRAMVDWAAAAPSETTAERFFPHLPKRALLARGYIAARSTHSTGLAVDVTLVASAASRTEAPHRPCRGPADDSLDMGTTFDCFDPLSHTGAAGIGAEARRHRGLLVAAMQRHGFANYRREWWHFTFAHGQTNIAFDFPIVARPAQ
jgi:D-alanyl-D-alanine dipeptidase